jgi:hypothetical protein
MNGNAELLNYIHQNSEMGIETINQLMSIVRDEEYKKLLQSQYNEYKSIYDAVNLKFAQLKKEAKDISTFSKVTSYIMININTLTDKSPSHISEMLIRGSTMGIVEITKNINEYKDADPEILAFANRLLMFEQQNVEECKKFLGVRA